MKIVRFIGSIPRRIVDLPRLVIPPSLTSTPSLPPPEEKHVQASSSTAPLLPTRPASRKRALLIGIQDIPPEKLAPATKAGKLKGKVAQKLGKQPPQEPEDQGALRGPHQDVRAMKQVLLELYGYRESDITILMDGDDCILPTEENILKHIDELVAGAAPGDTFFFHFSGHSKQEDTDNKEEEDGKDEFIVTYDDKYIRDDDLREKLVDPLPVGSRLIAVFDTCHSASLLDLKHFRCNRVWVPWTNKGRRRSLTRQNGVVRQFGRPMSPKLDGAARRFLPGILKRKPNHDSIEQVLESPVQRSIDSRRRERRHNVNVSTLSDDPHTPLSPAPKNRTLSGQSGDAPWLSSIIEGAPLVRTVSPEELFCSGWCGRVVDADKKFPDVISLSAAKDGERAWEDSQGCSMTQCLIRILLLGQDNHPTLHDLLLNVSHDLHALYLDIHAKSRDYKKKARLANLKLLAKGRRARTPEQVEMDNFQNPQISSLYPLDMENQRWAP
ncbi:hypothetical protein H1R20_g14131, partial [Candolleomyces eurysporus]